MEDYEKELIENGLHSIDLSELHSLRNAGGSLGFPELTPEQMTEKLLRGDAIWDPEQFHDSILSILWGEVQDAASVGIQMVAICILVGMLEHLSNSFGGKTVSRIGSMICSCAIAALCLSQFGQVYKICSGTAEMLSFIMTVLLPVLLPLLIAVGGPAAGGTLHPLILTSVTLFSALIKKMILPCMFFSGILFLTNSLTQKGNLKKLSVLLRNAGIFITGLAVTLFSGLTELQNIVSASADGMLAKTVRYSADHFIPIIGRFAADSLDLVISCVSMIKSSVGLIGIILILSVLLIPILKILAIALIFKLTAILTEPLGNPSLSDCMDELGTTMLFMMAILLLTGILFLLFLTILIHIGNVSR